MCQARAFETRAPMVTRIQVFDDFLDASAQEPRSPDYVLGPLNVVAD